MFVRSYAEDFVVITLQPFLRQMEEGRRDSVAQIPFENLFRQVLCWKGNYSELPRHHRIFGYDPGMPRAEMDKVYPLIHAAFGHVFPDHAHLGQAQAAEFIEWLIRSVWREVFEGRPAVPGHKEQLTEFVKKVVELLKSPAADTETATAQEGT